MSQQSKAEKQRNDIERVAFEVYQNRQQLERPGDAQDDWKLAEKIVQSPARWMLFNLRKPTKKGLKFLSWDAPKWVIFSLPKLEWVKLLAVPLAIATAGSIISGQIQREANQNSALKEYFNQLEKLTFEQKLLSDAPSEGAIVMARGRTVAALRELDLPRKAQLIAFLQASGLLGSDDLEIESVVSFKDQNLSGLELKNIDLSQASFQDANLQDANLQGANLQDSNLNDINLENANLKGANLFGAKLVRASLEASKLKGASLFGANLTWANLEKSNLRNANLQGAILENANLQGANFKQAELQGAVLKEANLYLADFQKANLYLADLQGAVMRETDLEGVLDLTDFQLNRAQLCRTIFPKEITLDPNRDCETLGINPETGKSIKQ